MRTPLFDTRFQNTVHELEDAGDAEGLITLFHEVQSPQDKHYISMALMSVMDKTPIEMALILNGK